MLKTVFCVLCAGLVFAVLKSAPVGSGCVEAVWRPSSVPLHIHGCLSEPFHSCILLRVSAPVRTYFMSPNGWLLASVGLVWLCISLYLSLLLSASREEVCSVLACRLVPCCVTLDLGSEVIVITCLHHSHPP